MREAARGLAHRAPGEAFVISALPEWELAHEVQSWSKTRGRHTLAATPWRDWRVVGEGSASLLSRPARSERRPRSTPPVIFLGFFCGWFL